MGKYCAVANCYENTMVRKVHRRRYYRFPVNMARAIAWMEVIGRMDLKDKSAKTLNNSYAVCDRHFLDTDFYLAKVKSKLKCNAIPSLMLPQLDEPSGTSKYTQTEEDLFEKCRCHCHSQYQPLATALEFQPKATELEFQPEATAEAHTLPLEGTSESEEESKKLPLQEEAEELSSDGEIIKEEVKLELVDEFAKNTEFL